MANAFAEESDAARGAGEHALIIGFFHGVSKRLKKASLLNARRERMRSEEVFQLSGQ